MTTEKGHYFVTINQPREGQETSLPVKPANKNHLDMTCRHERKFRLLDLFCGASGAAVGYHRAGFEVVGVDHKFQPRYPFEFHQADALTFPLDGYDVIHASPPCQVYSTLTPAWTREKHEDLIDRTRDYISTRGRCFYVIENISGARYHLLSPIMLCGTMFGLKIWRHRFFESWPPLAGLLPCCSHIGKPVDVSGTGGRRINFRRDNHGGNANKPRNLSEAREAMGIDWMTRYELSQAIPPAYTFWIGQQLIRHLRGDND